MRRNSSLVAAGAILVALVARCGGETVVTTECSLGQMLCGETCASLDRDPANCGSCGTICGAGTVCFHGTCATSCGGGTTQCGQSCVDISKDRDNCGACGAKCPAALVCSLGSCSSTCGAVSVYCDADGGIPYCADTASDNANCGGCGKVCDSTLKCTFGTCALTCKPQQTYCNDACIDPDSDPNNCGQCGVVCGNFGVCSGGGCVCTNGDKWCGSCVDTKSDDQNCGTCGTVCSSHHCALGKCQLMVLNYDGAIAADDTSFYVGLFNGVTNVPNGGGTSTVITTSNMPSGDVVAIVLDKTTAYFTASTNQTSYVCSVPKTGGAVTILATVSDNARSLTIDGTNAYVNGGNALYQVPLAGGGTTTLAINDGNWEPHPSIAVDGTSVYWIRTQDIARIPIGGGTVSTIYSGSAWPLVTSKGMFFFGAQNAVLTTSSSWNWVTHAVLIGGGPMAVAATTGLVYVNSNGAFWSVDPTSLSQTQVFVPSSYGFTLAASSTYLTWSYADTYQVQL